MGKKKNSRSQLSDSTDITDASLPSDIELTTPPDENDQVSDVDQGKMDSDMESIDVNVQDDFKDGYKDGYNDPDIPLPTPPVEKEGVPGFNLIKASGLCDTSSPSIVKSDLPDHATPSPIVSAKSLPLPPVDVFGTPELPSSPINIQNDPTDPDSKSKVFTNRMDVNYIILMETVHD